MKYEPSIKATAHRVKCVESFIEVHKRELRDVMAKIFPKHPERTDSFSRCTGDHARIYLLAEVILQASEERTTDQSRVTEIFLRCYRNKMGAMNSIGYVGGHTVMATANRYVKHLRDGDKNSVLNRYSVIGRDYLHGLHL